MKTRYKITIFGILVLAIIIGIFSYNFNPILHLTISDEHIIKTSNESEIVQTFLDIYPESEHRLVPEIEQEPAIVFEMGQEGKIVFLAVGNFDGENLTYMYTCFTSDYRQSLFHSSKVTSSIIRENPCF